MGEEKSQWEELICCYFLVLPVLYQRSSAGEHHLNVQELEQMCGHILCQPVPVQMDFSGC